MVALDQIRTVIRTYRDRLFTEIFPGRKVVPKTLIFAMDDSHADDIVRMTVADAWRPPAERRSSVRRSTLAAVNAAPSQAPGRPGTSAAAGNSRFATLFDAITANVAQVVQGKQQAIELAVVRGKSGWG